MQNLTCPSPKDEKRFWAKVDKTSTCWNWTAGKHREGYGAFRFDGQVRGAHRVIYQWIHGEVPDGMKIDHMCHNTGCVNPSHLRLVTNKQNLENRSSANRGNKSGVLGVHWNKKYNGWRATVRNSGQYFERGPFDTIEEAEVAAIELRLEVFTHNLVDQQTAA